MLNDQKLLAVWKENLLTDYKQTLYWDALPYTGEKGIDLFDLDPNDAQLPINNIKHLLETRTMGINVSPPASITEKLKKLHYNNYIIEKDKGQGRLAFGYPLFIQKDPNDPYKHIVAPVLLWDVIVEPDKKPDFWMVRCSSIDTIRPNKLLLYHLKKTYNIDIEENIRRHIGRNTLSAEDLLNIVNNICVNLDLDGHNTALNVSKNPTPNELDDILSRGGSIYWSGVIGDFPPLQVSDLNVLDKKIEEQNIRKIPPILPLPPKVDEIQSPKVVADIEEKIPEIDTPEPIKNTEPLKYEQQPIESAEELKEEVIEELAEDVAKIKEEVEETKEEVIAEESTKVPAVTPVQLPEPPVVDITIPEPTPPEPIVPLRQYSFTALPTDPYQEAVVRALDYHDKIVVEGAAGTGKTYTIASILTNALANKARVLVVSPKVKGLNQIQKLLENVGLQDLSFVLTNPKKQKEHLFDAYNANSLATKRMPQFEEEDFMQLLSLCEREQLKLDQSFKALSKPIFDKYTWTEIVGKFLKNHLQEGKQLLNSQLFTRDFKFTKEEYKKLTEIIVVSNGLYSKLNTLKHPLRVLDSRIFTDKTFEEAKDFTQNKIKETLEDVAAVYHKYVMYLESYSESLETQFETYGQLLKAKSTAVREDIADYKKRYGDDFDKWGWFRTLRLRSFSVFSKRHSNVLATKKQVRQAYEDLQGSYESKRYFAYIFDNKGGFSFSKTDKKLEDFEATIEEWKASTPSIIHNEVLRLNQENIHEDVVFAEKVRELDNEFAAAIEKLNNLGLYHKKFGSEADTLIKKRAYLEDVTETIEDLQYNLRDFDDYYNWTNYWLNLATNQQNVVKALIKTKPKNWVAAFNSWYFHHILMGNYSTTLPQSDEMLQSFGRNYESLRKLLPKKALKYWKFRQASEVRRLRKENKVLHQFIFGKARDRNLKELTTDDLVEDKGLFASMFPVLLTTPTIASEYLEAKENDFDIVIIDDAESLQMEEAIGSIWRGKRVVVFGDNQLGNIRIPASLLASARQSDFVSYNLYHTHATLDERIFKFRNAAFYNNQLKMLPNVKLENKEAIVLKRVEGVYIPEDKVNREEAEQVMRLLNDITVMENGFYPSVGIVCFTVEQRNLLIYFIRQIKRLKVAGNEKIKQLERAGLAIYHIDDLQGHQFDTLVVSTTFGEDSRGVFTTDITRLNELEGLQALNLFTGAALKKVILCTSISQDYVEDYMHHVVNANGLNILMNYIAYADAINRDDHKEEEEILFSLLANNKDTQEEVKEKDADAFVSEVIKMLNPYFEDGRLVPYYSQDDLMVDFVIHPLHEGEPPVVIQSDGFFWRYPSGAYTWDLQLRKQLQSLGYHYLPIWSVDWWKNPENSVKKLTAQLIRLDQAYAPKPISPALPQPLLGDEIEEVTEGIEDELMIGEAATDGDNETSKEEGTSDNQEEKIGD